MNRTAQRSARITGHWKSSGWGIGVVRVPAVGRGGSRSGEHRGRRGRGLSEGEPWRGTCGRACRRGRGSSGGVGGAGAGIEICIGPSTFHIPIRTSSACPSASTSARRCHPARQEGVCLVLLRRMVEGDVANDMAGSDFITAYSMSKKVMSELFVDRPLVEMLRININGGVGAVFALFR